MSTRHHLRVGDATIEAAEAVVRERSVLYVNLHDDEDTAVQAGMMELQRRGGRLVELRHSGHRNIEFGLGGRRYAFDPNRIFTRRGIAQTLARLSRRDTEAENAVARFAEELLELYDVGRADAIIALHNNGGHSYSAASYTQGQHLAGDAQDVYLAPGFDPSDFYFVTERLVFEAIRDRRLNVVLQDNRRVADDGSLSVYCARAGVRYINVEARHGHLNEQAEMLRILGDVLRSLAPRSSR
jgi:hypothetical protein